MTQPKILLHRAISEHGEAEVKEVINTPKEASYFVSRITTIQVHSEGDRSSSTVASTAASSVVKGQSSHRHSVDGRKDL